ncbi:MAG: hypothetical protein JXA67_14395, partial [Micromonosporaceae bacterium]|nr:hypothetical protein [Micromonosporaceae bacterium]
MDFWDLAKLLIRRWFIVVPLLLLTGGLSALAVSEIKPDYIVTAYVQLVPPTVTKIDLDGPSAEQRNPWFGLGTESLANAAIVAVSDQDGADGISEATASGSFSLTLSDRSPLITIEVVNTSRERAEQMVAQLVEQLVQSVRSLQTAHGVARPDLVTAERLDRGTNVAESLSNVKRALIAIIAVGLLLTMAVTIGIDAWLRRRHRRRRAAGTSMTSAETAPPVETTAEARE